MAKMHQARLASASTPPTTPIQGAYMVRGKTAQQRARADTGTLAPSLANSLRYDAPHG
jgi:hypothetical protein